jgi:hypothetical protein
MNRRTRSLIKVISILLVLTAVLLELGVLNVSILWSYKFWMTVIGYGLLLLVSRA